MPPKSSPRPPKTPPKSTMLGPRCPQDLPSSAQDAHLDAIMDHLGPNLEPSWPQLRTSGAQLRLKFSPKRAKHARMNPKTPPDHDFLRFCTPPGHDFQSFWLRFASISNAVLYTASDLRVHLSTPLGNDFHSSCCFAPSVKETIHSTIPKKRCHNVGPSHERQACTELQRTFHSSWCRSMHISNMFCTCFVRRLACLASFRLIFHTIGWTSTWCCDGRLAKPAQSGAAPTGCCKP